jgi:hypothetical protein
MQEFDNWEKLDKVLSRTPCAIIFVSGERWGCPPCLKKRPLFEKMETPDKKFVFHARREVASDWQHFGLSWETVPTFIQKGKKGYAIVNIVLK